MREHFAHAAHRWPPVRNWMAAAASGGIEAGMPIMGVSMAWPNLCNRRADTQAGKCAGALCINDAAQIGGSNARFFEEAFDLRRDLFGLLGADVFVKQADFALMFQYDGQKGCAGVDGRSRGLSVGMVLFFRRIWVAIIVERRGEQSTRAALG